MSKAASQLPGARREIGGNAPAMARRMAMEGADIMLAARFSKETLKTLPPSIRG